jgi:hypothetical protein
LGVALPAGAAMSSRGGSTRGARGTERCPRDLMLGLVRTRQFADRHRHVPPGWGVTGGDGGAWGKVLDGWGEHFMAGGRNGGFRVVWGGDMDIYWGTNTTLRVMGVLHGWLHHHRPWIDIYIYTFM